VHFLFRHSFKVKLVSTIAQAELVNLNEDTIRRLDVNDSTILVEVKAKKIVTIKLQTKSNTILGFLEENAAAPIENKLPNADFSCFESDTYLTLILL
jgi:hypothetical protein